MVMKRLRYLSFFILLLPWTEVLVAGSTTNVEQYGTLYQQVFDHVFSPVNIQTSIPIVLNRMVSTPSTWIMEQHLHRWIQEKGCNQIFTSRPDSISSYYQIDYQPVSNQVHYKVHPADSDSLLRTLWVKCYLRLTHPDNRLIVSTTQVDSITDIIGPDELERIENSQLPYTQGEKPENRNWRRFVEPTIVSVITGVVIYSFYSLRSR